METASAWVFIGELPSPRRSLRGATIDNKVLMTGNCKQSGMKCLIRDGVKVEKKSVKIITL